MKGEAMKRFYLLLVIGFACLILAGCGPSAEEIMKETMRASKEVKTAHFKEKWQIKLPRAPIQEGKVQKQNYLYESEGDVDYRTGDMKVKTDIAPGVQATAMKIGEKLYVQLGGKWYEMPQSFQLPAPVSQALSISQYLKYFKELKKEGGTKIDGEACYHVKGVPNMEALVKLPGVTDLLKDPSGQQVRTVDDLKNIKASFDFFIQKKNMYFKASREKTEFPASEELIKLGYAEAGDKVKGDVEVTLSDFNKKLNLQVPSNVQPWPVQD